MACVGLAFAICCPGLTLAQQVAESDSLQLPQSWSYNECIEYAKANNIDLRQSLLNRELGGYDLEAAKGQWLPTFNFSTSHRLSNYPSPSGGNFTYDEGNGTLARTRITEVTALRARGLFLMGTNAGIISNGVNCRTTFTT